MPHFLRVTSKLPETITLLSHCITVLIFSVFYNAQQVLRDQLNHLMLWLLLSVKQDCGYGGSRVRLTDVTQVWD